MLIMGEPREELGQLEGRAYKASAPTPWQQRDATQERGKVEWVVQAIAGSTVELLARHERAGVVRTEVVLT
jgi:hypothetical protein